jgi:hypothetical protein
MSEKEKLSLEEQKAIVQDKIADLQIEIDKLVSMMPYKKPVNTDALDAMVHATGMDLGGHPVVEETIEKTKKEDEREIYARIDFATPKAIQVSYNGKLAWVPKSTLKCQIDDSNKGDQVIIMENWIYKKNWGS